MTGSEAIITVPFPAPGTELLEPPGPEESRATARGIATAISPPGGLTPLQAILLKSVFRAMTGTDVDLRDTAPMGPNEFAQHLARRTEMFRTRGVQVMLLGALILRPLPPEVVTRIRNYARALGVDETMIPVAQRFAEGSLGLAGVDFERNGYTADWDPSEADALHVTRELSAAWDAAVDDPELAGRWEALGDLAPGTLGRAVWQLYRARGFEFPGRPGSAPPLLAQHDWVHVVADYGTTVESELEVFALIARANDNMRAFSLLAMVISLFETGYLRTGAGLFEAAPGYLSRDNAVAVRMADGMRRGALCRDLETRDDSVDFLQVDWFALADHPLTEVQERFNLQPKAADAVGAGSVSPWEPGGISPFQADLGAEQAARHGRPYDSFGASPR
jgi:hypothetical protein